MAPFADGAQRLGGGLHLVGTVQVVDIVFQGTIIVVTCDSKRFVADVCLQRDADVNILSAIS